MFNRVCCLIIRGVTETLKCLNFLILFLAITCFAYSGKTAFDLIAISGFTLYILTTISIKFINKNSTKKNLIFFISMVLSFIISFAIIKHVPRSYKPFSLLYFLATVLFASFHYNNAIDDLDAFIKRYAISTLILTVNVFFMQSSSYFKVIKPYFYLYIIMSIIYIAQVNVLEKYGSLSVNIINENKNIIRFNAMTITVTIISILTLTTNVFKRIYHFASYIIETLLYIFLKPLSWLMIWLHDSWLSKNSKNILEKLKKYEDNKNIQKNMEELQEEIKVNANNYDNTTLLFITKLIISIIFIAIVCIIIYAIYKKVMAIQNQAINLDVLDGEQRRFVFKKAKSEKVKEIKSKETIKDLHIIRRIYIDVIEILKSKGISYKNSYTPNEYNSVIENTEFKSKDVGHLINLYNKLRYGNKPISKEDISMASKIKENL